MNRAELRLYHSTVAARLLSRVPTLHGLAEKRYAQDFASTVGGGFCGVFASREEAARFVARQPTQGYDNASGAEMYRDRLEHVFPSDYAAMFWLREVLPGSARVFDIGGHVGIARIAYAKYLSFDPSLRWTVYDVPSVVEAGAKIAAERGIAGLDFTTRLDALDGADVLFSSGALQYLEWSLVDELAKLRSRPKALVLNLLSLTELRTFYTVQRMGRVFCPYALSNRRELFDGITRLGYELRDEWQNAEKSCVIPLHPQHSLDHYTGAFFTRRG